MTKHDAVTAFFQPKAEELAGQYLEFNYSDGLQRHFAGNKLFGQAA